MNLIKNKIKAIIFDMDGTIIKTGNIWKQATKDFLAIYGFYKLNNEQKTFLESIASTGLKNTTTQIKNKFGIQGNIDELIAKKASIAQTYMKKNGVQFIEGFENFHKKLQQHQISTGLATNANLKTLNFLKEKINLKNFFGNNMYCLEHVKYMAKPNPMLFLHTIEKLKVKPEQCIVFEDSVAGFEAAKKAGIKCIAIKNEDNKKILHYVDGSIENYNEAEEEIKKII
ncbi:HAD family phosphatase [Candidatus Babeliales bacterium]|nr:HAD family phosphatase [Candidatus Babeliales bacterium]